MNAAQGKVVHGPLAQEPSRDEMRSSGKKGSLPTTSDYTPVRAGAVTNFVCGAVIALLGLGSLLVASDLGFGSITQPRAGTWPAVLSALLLVLGALLMLRAKSYEDAEKLTRNAVAVGVGAVSIAVAVQLMPHIGFEIPAVLLSIFWMSVLGKEKYMLSVPVSIVAVAAFYFIFVVGLGVPIPRLF